MLRLSIIVPVFNVEKYLAKCLGSLLDQDLSNKEYEIIIINDGSTDGSDGIIQQYLKKYSHIKYISQENKGLGAARNTGIKEAKGKYIQFVDSDDFIKKDAITPLLDKMDQESLDILRFNYCNVNEEDKVVQPNKTQQFVDYKDEVCDGYTFLSERLGYACYACQFMINTELLKKSENNFKEGIYFEDTEWTPRILVQARRVTSVSTVVYFYLIRMGSITKSIAVDKKRKWINDKLYLIEILNKERLQQANKTWYNGMIALSVTSVISSVATNFFEERKLFIDQLKAIKVFPLSITKTNIKTRLRLMLVNFSPFLYCRLIHIIN